MIWVKNKNDGSVFWFLIFNWTRAQHEECVRSQGDNYEMLEDYTPPMFTPEGDPGDWIDRTDTP